MDLKITVTNIYSFSCYIFILSLLFLNAAIHGLSRIYFLFCLQTLKLHYLQTMNSAFCIFSNDVKLRIDKLHFMKPWKTFDFGILCGKKYSSKVRLQNKMKEKNEMKCMTIINMKYIIITNVWGNHTVII